jgi:hypothetical protein
MCDNPPVAPDFHARLSRMSNARKKVLIRRFAGDIVPGYLPLSGFVRGHSPLHVVDLLDLSGRIVEIALKDVKTISFVRDFNLTDTVNPERLTRRTFLARPRNEGLWVRIAFRSSGHKAEKRPENDLLEGLADTGISLIDSLIEDSGLNISPPDIRSNTQRIFVPRQAIADLQILAVITTPSRKPAPVKTGDQLRKELQESLFEAPTPPDTRPN